MFLDAPGVSTFRVDRRLTVVRDIIAFKDHNRDLYRFCSLWVDRDDRCYQLGRVVPMCVRLYRRVGSWFLWRAVAFDGNLPTFARRQLIAEFLHRQ